MEKTTKICSICGKKSAGTIKETAYCKKHFDELVITKPIANYQGKRRKQVEFAATLFLGSMTAIFLIAVVIAIMKLVN